MAAACELCEAAGGDAVEDTPGDARNEVIYRCEKYRIVLVGDAHYPGFCRVIWNSHVREVTDLPEQDRALLMNAVWQVEQAVREVMRPDKVNLASLGNMVAHVHWHIIPRYRDDTHFPQPIWAEVQRMPVPASLAARAALLPALRETISRLAGTE
jgi:diadenosine tetraphosphate (Ap4A) HIT family hydrolase